MTSNALSLITDKIIPVLGWGTIISFIAWAWKTSVTYKIKVEAQHTQGQRAMDQINTMSTNCFPTMEANLKAQTKMLETAEIKQDKVIEVLSNINTGIQVLVDRGR